ncbi:MAG: peptide chain release factor N(5)-glutamine methyltransferase [Legionellales bacterium]|jgi:release factor glutamine methyltransferase
MLNTITQLLKQTNMLLGESRSGEILLAHVLKKNVAYLYTHPEKFLTDDERKLFQSLIQRRKQGEPIAYILGEQEFYSLNFKVTQDTLIPRPETELLVDEALKLIGNKPCKVLELGIGSGSVAITLAKLKPNIHMLATDISQEALDVAINNAHAHQVNNIEFLLSDWFKNIPAQKFDLIISNPPYIAEHDPHLAALKFEPRRALTSGETGLDALSDIIHHAGDYLVNKGYILLEHGYDQKDAVQALCRDAQFDDIKTLLDIAGQPRVTFAKNH